MTTGSNVHACNRASYGDARRVACRPGVAAVGRWA